MPVGEPCSPWHSMTLIALGGRLTGRSRISWQSLAASPGSMSRLRPHVMKNFIANFVETLLASGVLDPAQREEFSREGLAHLGDLGSLTDELLRRGWLTRFQLAELTLGGGKGLVCGQYL